MRKLCSFPFLPTPPEGSSEEVQEMVAQCLRKELVGPGRRPTVPELYLSYTRYLPELCTDTCSVPA